MDYLVKKMKNMTDQLVSFKTAKLANDKGFLKISTDKLATKVKLADLKDNSDITRLKGLSKKDFDRMEKYHRSYIYLSKI